MTSYNVSRPSLHLEGLAPPLIPLFIIAVPKITLGTPATVIIPHPEDGQLLQGMEIGLVRSTDIVQATVGPIVHTDNWSATRSLHSSTNSLPSTAKMPRYLEWYEMSTALRFQTVLFSPRLDDGYLNHLCLTHSYAASPDTITWLRTRPRLDVLYQSHMSEGSHVTRDASEDQVPGAEVS